MTLHAYSQSNERVPLKRDLWRRSVRWLFRHRLSEWENLNKKEHRYCLSAPQRRSNTDEPSVQDGSKHHCPKAVHFGRCCARGWNVKFVRVPASTGTAARSNSFLRDAIDDQGVTMFQPNTSSSILLFRSTHHEGSGIPRLELTITMRGSVIQTWVHHPNTKGFET